MDDLKALAALQYSFALYSDKGIQARVKLYSNIRIIRISAGRSTLDSTLNKMEHETLSALRTQPAQVAQPILCPILSAELCRFVGKEVREVARTAE